jgi:hypothetical protein
MLAFYPGLEAPKSAEHYNAEVFLFIVDTLTTLRSGMQNKRAALDRCHSAFCFK